MNELVYRPQHKTEDEIRNDFVIRLLEFEKIMQGIKAYQPGISPQHVILQGQRGMGKTTLMYRVYYQTLSDYRKEGIVPVIFSEEQYSIRTLYKLWEQIARFLEDNESSYLGIWYEMQNIQDVQYYEEKCFELLQRAVRKNKHRLLLLIDNFGMMVDKFTKQEQQRFREILITFHELKIVGGSAVVLESFYKYDKPFFDFFKIIQLEPLTSKEVKTLLLKLGEKHNVKHIKDIIRNQPGRIDSMRILTGGVPRTMVLLFNIFLDSDHGSSIEDLKKLLDQVTPLYKHRMDELPPQQQEIVDKLALNWDGMGVSELVKKTRMESKVLSAQLNNLVKSGVVYSQKSSGKNKFYQLDERFFNIWYLMHHAPRSTRQKVIWLTRFLEFWCPGEILEETVTDFLNRLKQEKMHPEYVKAMTLAYSRVYGLSVALRDELIEAARTALGLKQGKSSDDLPPLSEEAIQEVEKLVEEKKYAQAIAVIERSSFPDDLTNTILGYIYSISGKIREAELHYMRALNKDNVSAMFGLALLYESEFQDYTKAEQYYLMAVEKGDEKAMVNVALHYKHKYNDYAKAEQYLLMAVEKGDGKAMFIVALLYQDKYNDYARAEQYYLMAVEKGDGKAMFNVALLYQDKYNDYKKAERYYLMAAEKGEVDAMISLALLYQNQFRDQDNADKFNLLAIAKGSSSGLNNMVHSIIDRNLKQRKHDAKQWVENLLRLRPDNRSKLLKVRFLFWINEPEEAAVLLEEILAELVEDEKYVYALLLNTLAFAIGKGLKQYVFRLFQQEKYQLKDRLKVLYYALVKLMATEHPNEVKKMGKELREPVDEFVTYLKSLEEKYNKEE